MKTITAKSSVNIAVIKYWGKKDNKLIIPLNDSISGTLDSEHMFTVTTVAISNRFLINRMWLNEQEVNINDNQRLLDCLDHVKKIAADSWPSGHYVHICSKNNFPTAAGLASSAAGYACLMFALCNLFDIKDLTTISALARLGSGSACRSVYGGFVHWIAGDSMFNSISKQIVTENEWPEIRVLILVVNDQRKETSSTHGMKLSVDTSSLIEYRANRIVPERIKRITEAIQKRDFHQFAQITMQDSNQFHSICQDTYPPIRYMNDTSWSVVNLIHFVNKVYGENVAAYTFDAGPNACIYCLDKVVPMLITLIRLMYPQTDEPQLPIKGLSNFELNEHLIDKKLLEYSKEKSIPNALKYIISTKLGPGPKIISTDFDFECLLNLDGLPK